MEWFNTWTIIILFILLLIIYWYSSIPKNLPPGPIGLPLLGYAPFVERDFFKTLNDLGKKYGNIYHLYLGSPLMIVLNDFEVIKEAFVKQGDIFAGRPKIGLNSGVFNEWFGGVGLSDGEFWKQHRRFLLHGFKDYGIGKSMSEPLILDEIRHFIEEIQAHNEKPFNILELLLTSMSNNVQIWLTGKRIEYSDPLLRQMIKLLKESEDLANIIKYLIAFPWASPFLRLIFYNCFKNAVKVTKTFASFLTTAITDIKKRVGCGQSDNYLQSYLTEKEERLINNSSENVFTNEALVNNTRDILFAGTDTSANTVLWLIIYMTAFPEIQKKVQQEIEQIIGRDREPTYNDRLNTPYTEATILETHRFASIAPYGIPRRTSQPTKLRGYNIPKDTVAYPNLWAVHHDPKLWGDPENFRPERFLNSKGECVKPEYLIPFSIGKRVCLGEALARVELYLYFVCLLQRFNFVPSNKENLSLEPIAAVVLHPKSDLICAELRKH